MKAKSGSSLWFLFHSLGRIIYSGTILLIGLSVQAQNLFEADRGTFHGLGDGNIYEFTPSGVQSTVASKLSSPEGLAVDSAGDLFVADTLDGKVLEFNPDGEMTTFATGFELGSVRALAFNASGDLFVLSAASATIYEVTPGGAQSVFASILFDTYTEPSGLAFDAEGHLFVTDSYNGSVYELTTSGVQSTFASGFIEPACLTFNSADDLFVGGAGKIIEITPGGAQTTFATGVAPWGLACDSFGDLFDADAGGNINEFTPDGTKSIFASGLSTPFALAFQPVPEPSALGLLVVGATALLLRRHFGMGSVPHFEPSSA